MAANVSVRILVQPELSNLPVTLFTKDESVQAVDARNYKIAHNSFPFRCSPNSLHACDVYTLCVFYDRDTVLENAFSRRIFYLGFTARHDYFTHFEPSQSYVGRKWEILEKNHLTTHKKNLACLTCDIS